MQNLWLLQGICDELDIITRKLIWGSSSTHWVNWRTMTQPRNKGGLGIKPLRGQCFHVRKHIGTCLSEPNKLWVQLVDAKYLHGESILHRHEFPNSSCT
ncbi:putative ribonuclease H protein [Glycine soja]